MHHCTIQDLPRDWVASSDGAWAWGAEGERQDGARGGAWDKEEEPEAFFNHLFASLNFKILFFREATLSSQ